MDSLLSKLFSRINYEREIQVAPEQFRLRNMRALLAELGSPHLSCPVIHVAGTKGKGSVSTMIARVLTESGLKTGLYTSPHLDSIAQRIAIDGVPIEEPLLEGILTAMEPAIESIDNSHLPTTETKPEGNESISALESIRRASRDNSLTFFEITTAAAFVHFAQQKCDAIVLEVGLGGRLDSTNVCHPEVCVITNISLDHTKQLGETVEQIAAEKAGIIKLGVPVVTAAENRQALQVIRQVAASRQAPLFELNRDFHVFRHAPPASAFDFRGAIELSAERDSEPNFRPPQVDAASLPEKCTPITRDNLQLQLVGQHQQVNAAVAIAAIEVLRAKGWEIGDQAIRQGLAKTALPGRLEVVSRRPWVILDMAHNVASITALAHALESEFPRWHESRQRTLIFGTSADKDALGMLRPLLSMFDQVVLTQYQLNPRGVPPEQLLDLIRSKIHGESDCDRANSRKAPATLRLAATPEQAWQLVSADSQPDDFICITGSIFLLAEVNSLVRN